MILSGIDIGTNSLRLLIAETGDGSFHKLHSDRRTTRLGEHLDESGVISSAAWSRSLQTLIDFKKSMDRYSVDASIAVGTSALRKAVNAALFTAEVFDRTGIRVQIISGVEEARLTLRGVLAALKNVETGRDSTLVIDIGGGSTEIISIGRNSQAGEISLPLGAVYLTDRFIKHDPPAQNDLAMIRNEVRRCLSVSTVKPATILMGTAGTITTLSCMDQQLPEYDPDKINGSLLRKSSVEEIVRKLSTSKLEERRSLNGLEPGREDIILAGAIVVEEIMDYCGVDQMLVSDWGLREGIILDLYDKISMSNSGTRVV